MEKTPFFSLFGLWHAFSVGVAFQMHLALPPSDTASRSPSFPQDATFAALVAVRVIVALPGMKAEVVLKGLLGHGGGPVAQLYKYGIRKTLKKALNKNERYS